MSHYTVAVFTVDECQSVDDLLAPYDEGISMDPYVDMTREEFIRHRRERMQETYDNCYVPWKTNPETYEKTANPAHIDYLKSLPERMQWTDDQIYEDAIQGYDAEDVDEDGSILSRYNPYSKWDWYEVGGRWRDMLMLKSEESDQHQFCDAAYAADIDFDAMRKKQLSNIRPYQEAMKNSFYKEEYLRELYPSEAEYHQRMTAFSTYAVITPDGEWHAPGDMGWFGMSSETIGAKRDWEDEYYDEFIRPAIENGWYLTIVDCHI